MWFGLSLAVWDIYDLLGTGTGKSIIAGHPDLELACLILFLGYQGIERILHLASHSQDWFEISKRPVDINSPLSFLNL